MNRSLPGRVDAPEVPPAAGDSTDELRDVAQALRTAEIAGWGRALFPGSVTAAARLSRCRILDVRYEAGVGCTVLYDLDGRLVIGTLSWQEASDAPIRPSARRRVGPTLHAFPVDPGLPGLVRAMQPDVLAARLGTVLPDEGAWRVIRCRVRPLRYRPHRRCTLRVDVWARHAVGGRLGSHTVYAKVYPTLEKARSVHDTMVRLEELRARRGGPPVLARSLGVLPDLALVVQEPLGGTPLDAPLRPLEDGRPGADRAAAARMDLAAQALAGLHGLEATHPRERPIAAELNKLTKRTRALASADRHLGASMLVLAEALAAGIGPLALEDAPTVLVHGDCKPSQFLIDGTTVGLLDFDHAGMADAALDVGTFLASIRQLACRGRIKGGAVASAGADAVGLEIRFLDAYREAARADESFLARVSWYEAFALLRKAWRAFGRSMRSPLPVMLVDEAGACLARTEAAA